MLGFHRPLMLCNALIRPPYLLKECATSIAPLESAALCLEANVWSAFRTAVTPVTRPAFFPKTIDDMALSASHCVAVVAILFWQVHVIGRCAANNHFRGRLIRLNTP